MRALDLFSGIGGFSLGLERAGMRTVAFCEIEPYCRAVLAKHWPDVPCFPDIRGIDSFEIGRIGRIDVICGGFPCQDISLAGKGAGLAGARSGLWSEYLRLIRIVQPRFVIVENVAALLSRGLADILGQLAEIGYDAEWHCIPAAYVGAPHRRDRIWIIAHPDRDGESAVAIHAEMAGASTFGHPDETRSENDERWPGSAQQNRRPKSVAAISDRGQHHWLSEPPMVRVVHGLSRDVDAVGALGNSVVPQVVEMIGRAIMTQSNQEK